ncbi:MAG: hypothetical protein QOI10_2134 [Solirubrobacterales bacterium]|jgi:PAS domain S-box-containing protein|nr:hypothetical protein [Solirubrobacterales bacterium]
MSNPQAEPQATDPILLPRRHWLVALGLIGLGLLLVQLASRVTQLGSPEADEAIGDWTYRALMAGAALAVLASAALRRRDRLAWTVIGIGLAAYAAGNLYNEFDLANNGRTTYPSPGDLIYLAGYVGLIAGVRLLGARFRGVSILSLGLVVTLLGLATLWSWLVFGSVLADANGDSAAIATTLSYPALDLVLVGSTLIALAARGWRFDRVFVTLAAGFALAVVADSIIAVRVAQGAAIEGSLPETIWPVGILLIATAAWLRPGAAAKTPRPNTAIVPAVSLTAITIAITGLVWDHFSRLGLLTIVLAVLTLIAGFMQLVLLYRAHGAATARALRSESVRSASTEGALDCVITVDAQGMIREWNDAASATFGHCSDDAIGRELATLIIPPAERDHHRRGLKLLVETGDGPILNRRIEGTALRAGGAEFPIELAITQVQADPPMYTGFLRDISDRKAREAENTWLASIVRSSGDAIISRDLAGAVTAWNHGAELLYGYTAEEAIGSKLNSLILPVDRDEEINGIFGQLSDGPVAAYETERQCKDGRLVTVSTRAFAVRDSAGKMVGASAIAHDVTELRRREERERQDLEATLWRERTEAALDDDRLVFFGQPVVDLRSGTVDHQELLVRMDLDGEIVPPGAFLPHAEQTELIRRVDRWAVERGIGLARSGRVAINLSAKSLDDAELIETIAKALADRALAENVIFEITETAAASNMDDAQRLVTKLTALGCGVALDDFGTGYGSFTYLKRLPITELKIDIQFIRGLVDDPADQSVVRSMISAARNFGIRTVAEGVEDEATLELLRELGVDMVQGYHLGRPAPISPAAGRPRRIQRGPRRPTRPPPQTIKVGR